MNISIAMAALMMTAAMPIRAADHATVDGSGSGPVEKPSATAAGDDAFGFRADKVTAPDPAQGTPVARLFYDYIYLRDLKAATPTLNDDEASRLVARIFDELRERYVQRDKITATPEEIEQFVAAMSSMSAAARADDGDAQDIDQNAKDQRRRGWERLGDRYVKGWKLDRSLYKRYGGVVIFQQANPLEPVGAYRKFLEDMERATVFEIFDPANRQKFWHYFVREHPMQIPGASVDFDKPWWLYKK